MTLEFEKELQALTPDQSPQPNMLLALELAAKASKFLLPPGGRLFDDKEFKALDESEPLRLPFPVIALEYEQPIKNNQAEALGMTLTSSKRIVFVSEGEGWLTLLVVCWVDSLKSWLPFPTLGFIPVTGCLDRTAKPAEGRVPICFKRDNEIMPGIDFNDELGAILCFLNSLQCANVKIDHSAPKASGKKIKTAHAFDAYHFLTIARQSDSSPAKTGGPGGEHRSPREHLRRGHIRRLEGRKIWVNAALVNAGSAGAIAKSYLVGGAR